MTSRHTLIAALLAVLLSGCSHTLSDDDGFHVRIRDGAVLLQNNTDERIYYIIYGRRAGRLIDWYPTLRVEWSVGSGEVRQVSFDEIDMSREGEEELEVYWWNAVSGEDGDVPGDIQHLLLEL